MKLQFKIYLTSLFIVIVSVAHATNYYVATTGNDLNTGLTTRTAFKTIQKALDIVVAGDVINILGGIYKERLEWKKSGTVSAPITLKNYNTAIVYIDGSSGGTNNSQNEMLLIENKNNITVQNVHIRNNYRNNAVGLYIRGYGSNIKILNSKIYNIGWTTDKTLVPTSTQNANPFLVVGTSASSINNLTISGNQVYNCITGFSEGLTLNGNVESCIISNNTVYNLTNIGIDIAGHYDWTGAPASVNKARNGVVRDNIVYNCISNYAPSAGIYVDGAENILIERNKSYNNSVGFSIGCENGGKVVSGIIMRDNIIYNNKIVGLYFGSNHATSLVVASQVMNNTFYKNATTETWGAEISVQNSNNNVVKQNIIVPRNDKSVGIGIWSYTSTNLIVDYNLFWRPTTNKTTNFLAGVSASNSVFGNPNFVNPTYFDLHLLTGSKAINTGDPTFFSPLGETDFEKNARIQMGRIDIGAYESALSSFIDMSDNTQFNQTIANTEGEEIKVSPNPSNGVMQLSINENAHTLLIYNAVGKILKAIRLNNTLTTSIDISDLPDGIYFYNILFENQDYKTIKVVKKAK